MKKTQKFPHLSSHHSTDSTDETQRYLESLKMITTSYNTSLCSSKERVINRTLYCQFCLHENCDLNAVL